MSSSNLSVYGNTGRWCSYCILNKAVKFSNGLRQIILISVINFITVLLRIMLGRAKFMLAIVFSQARIL